MADIKYKCPECQKTIKANIGQAIIDSRLRWYLSYTCNHCSSIVGMDDLGFPPDAIRQKILDKEGEWIVNRSLKYIFSKKFKKTIIFGEMKTRLLHKNKEIYQFLFLVLIVLLQFINFLIIYPFLLDLKLGLYPYADIGGDFYPYLVGLKALFFQSFFATLGFIIGVLSFIVCLCVLRRSSSIQLIKYIFLILFLISIAETLFCGYRFLELRYVISLTENCEFPTQQEEGCYIPPEKF